MEKFLQPPPEAESKKTQSRIAVGQELTALRGNTSLREIGRRLKIDSGYLSRVEKGKVPTSSRVIEGYIQHAKLDGAMVEEKTVELKLLASGVADSDHQLAHILALALLYIRRNP